MRKNNVKRHGFIYFLKIISVISVPRLAEWKRNREVKFGCGLLPLTRDSHIPNESNP